MDTKKQDQNSEDKNKNYVSDAVRSVLTDIEKDLGKPTFTTAYGGGLAFATSAVGGLLKSAERYEDFTRRMRVVKDYLNTAKPNLTLRNAVSYNKDKNALSFITSSLGTDNANQNEYIGATLMANNSRSVAQEFGKARGLSSKVLDSITNVDLRDDNYQAILMHKQSEAERRNKALSLIKKIKEGLK